MIDLSALFEKATSLIGDSNAADLLERTGVDTASLGEMAGSAENMLADAGIDPASLGELAGSAENLLADAGIDPSNMIDSGTLEALTNLIGQRGP